jgi:hypothetical protein
MQDTLRPQEHLMKPRHAVPLGSLLFVAVLAGPSRSGDPEERKAFIDSATVLGFKMEAIKPQADEVRWLQIPWVLDLAAAAKASKAEHRPMLIWASGDEPLERC